MADPNVSALVRVGSEGSGKSRRAYCKGNWTLHETVVLISAKKLDDERRLKGGEKEKNKISEFRWKWIENYCWKNGCLRSQNQCNDKWDNLLRDFKKVRDNELKLIPGQPSYWQLEKHDRKEKGLPSNLTFQVYEALQEVVDKNYHGSLPQGPITVEPRDTTSQQAAGPSRAPQPPASGPYTAEQSQSSDSEGSEAPPSLAKRRKVWRDTDGIGPAVAKCTSELKRTLLACEEKKEKRHRDLLGVEERKLHMEETKTEISRQGISDLISAVNNLANAILTLASDKNVTGN